MRQVLFLAGVVCLATFTAEAQDPVQVDPKHCKVEFENADVRVLRWNVGPHENVPMHEHPLRVNVWLTDAHTKSTYPDGRIEERILKAGAVVWATWVRHADENLSDKPFDLVQVELKSQPAASRSYTFHEPPNTEPTVPPTAPQPAPNPPPKRPPQ